VWGKVSTSSERWPMKHLDNRHLTSGSVPRVPCGAGDKKPIQNLSTELVLRVQIGLCSVFPTGQPSAEGQALRQLSANCLSPSTALLKDAMVPSTIHPTQRVTMTRRPELCLFSQIMTTVTNRTDSIWPNPEHWIGIRVGSSH
jgi:hypothetical protein